MIKFDYVQTSERLYPKDGTCPLEIVLKALPPTVDANILQGSQQLPFILKYLKKVKDFLTFC